MKVPGYQPSVQESGYPDVRQSSVAADTSDVGQSLRYASRVVQEIGRREMLQADHIALQQAENSLSSWSQEQLLNPENGALTKKGQDAFGLSTALVPKFDEEAGKIASTLKTPRQQRAFQEVIAQRRLQVKELLDRHEAGERDSFYDQETESTIKDSVKSAGNFFQNPEQIAYELQRQADAIEAQGDRKGWSPQETKEAIRSFKSKTHLEVLDRMLALRKDSMARNYLNQVRGSMLGDDVTTVERALATNNEISKGYIRDQINDVEAMARAGKEVTSIPSRDSLVASFGEYEGDRLYNRAKGWADASKAIQQLHGMSQEQLIEQAAASEPQTQEGAANQLEVSNLVDSQIHEILKQREQDPAAYLINTDPQVQQAWKNLFTENGDPEEYMRLIEAKRQQLQISSDKFLPKAYEDTVVKNITEPSTDMNLYQAINRESERWGPMWPKVYSQVAPKLPDSAAVIASGIPPQAALSLSSVANLKNNELAAMVPNGHKWGEIEEEVRSQFKDFLRTFPPDDGGMKTARAIQESAVRLALVHMKSGGSNVRTAVGLAYNELASSQYHTLEFRSMPYRAPAGLDKQTLERGVNALLNTYQASPDATRVLPTGLAEADLYSSQFVKDHGYWVTNPRGTGLRLYVDGAPVPDVGAQPVEFSWAEIMDAGEEVNKKIRSSPRIPVREASDASY